MRIRNLLRQIPYKDKPKHSTANSRRDVGFGKLNLQHSYPTERKTETETERETHRERERERERERDRERERVCV